MTHAHLHDIWINTCGYWLVGMACAFRSCMCIASFPGSCVGGAHMSLGMRLACATKCKKFEKEGKAYVLSLRMWACSWTTQNVRIWSFIKTTTCFISFTRHCCSLSYSSFSTWTSRCCGYIYILSSLPFSCKVPSSRSLPSQFLPFWRWDNETASTITALRTINLRTECLIAFLSGANVCAQATSSITF